MSKFMIGDRVQQVGQPTDYDLGTVTDIFGEADPAADYMVEVNFDSSGETEYWANNLFLVYRSQLNAPQLADLDDYATVRPATFPRRQARPSEPLAEWERKLLEPTFAEQVDTILASVGTLLKQKNEAYGDSALNPVRIFSKADPADGLRVRIDDKLSRIARGADAGEDTVTDLLGYLVLLKIGEGNK